VKHANEPVLELRLLRAFVAVAEELHFGRAARRLHISQPPLSAQIRRLEQRLDVRLFDRDRRGVALTDAGGALLGGARHLLSEAERTRRQVESAARGAQGVLSIGYTPTATYDVLPAVIPAFRARVPDVRLDLAEMRSELLSEAVRSGRVEVGFVCAPVDCRGLVETVLVRESLLALLPERHRLAERARVPVRALGREPFVMVRRDIEPGWADKAAAALRGAGVHPNVVQETDSKIALLGLVAAGMGVSVVSQSMARLGRTGVTLRPLDGLSLRLNLSLLTSETPSPRATIFAEVARGEMAKAAAPPRPRRKRQ
jgi:DNA-binding transcriptional LysR family regulator